MKIGTSNSNTLITSTEQTSRSKFSIQATGKAFAVLSNALYQYKVRAVVREIGCNAYDAHIDAGNTDVPFKVSLPCKEDPHFKVRDYGIGLPEDKFVEIYTTYFGSTKSDSNDSTGGFGLGSKTPFIMSKVFTVYSYYEGIEYMWHSYVNDNGEPDVVLLAKKATTEPNGLQVIVPIGQGMSDTEKNSLFREFRTEAEGVYQWFDTIPDVTVNGAAVAIQPRLHGAKTKYSSLKLKGVENTSVYYETDHSKGAQANEILVKMGNVVYPYKLHEVRNLDRFGGNVLHTEAVIKYLTNSGRLNIANHPIVVEVGMGDVDIAPSREALSLVNTTEVTIINAIVRFVDLFFDQLQHNIDNAKTTYEKYQNLYAVPPLAGRKFTIDGVEVNPHAQNPIWAFGTIQSLSGRTNFLRSFAIEDLAVKYRRAGTRGIIPMKTSFDMGMYGANIRDRTIILVDKEYKGELRLWVNANTNAESACVVVFGINDKGNPCPMTKEEMEPFLEDGHPQVIKFSELKNQPQAPANKPSIQSLKLTDDAYFEIGHLVQYHFFTQGNAKVRSVTNDSKKVDPATDELEELYVCYERHAGDVYGYVTADKKTVTPVSFGKWSRSQQMYTSYNRYCGFIHETFQNLPTQLVSNGRQNRQMIPLTYNINGKDYKVKKIVHVVMNREGYKEVVGNADYPQFINVDTAIRKVILPALPSDFEVVQMNNDMYLDRTSSFGARFIDTYKLHQLAAWIKKKEDFSSQDHRTYALNQYKDDQWVQEWGYLPLSTSNIKHHEYNVEEEDIWAAIKLAGADGVPGAAVLYDMFKGHNRSFSLADVFGHSYHVTESTRFGWVVSADLLNNSGYNGDRLSAWLIDYFEKNHIVS